MITASPHACGFSHLTYADCSPFLTECLKEWYSTYDDTLMQWNGAELMTRVIRNHTDSDQNREHLEIKLEPSFTFYPISSTDIMRYVVSAIKRLHDHPFCSVLLSGSNILQKV
jgi:hypothetical protein